MSMVGGDGADRDLLWCQSKERHTRAIGMLTSVVVLACACASPRANVDATPVTTPGPAEPAVVLSGLRFDGGFLEGEIGNRSNQELREIVVEIDFLGPDDTVLLTRDFRPVPGSDGKILLPKYTKHFRYRVQLHGTTDSVSIRGRLETAN